MFQNMFRYIENICYNARDQKVSRFFSNYFHILIFLYLESCEYQKIAGDGICNDEANLPDCNFDFGDCCLMAINDAMCADCECHSTQLVHPKLSGKLVHT